jgi:hypothetical protein
MRHITIIGAGLLIGTALAVIIPEGVHSLYSNVNHKHGESGNSKGKILFKINRYSKFFITVNFKPRMKTLEESYKNF